MAYEEAASQAEAAVRASEKTAAGNGRIFERNERMVDKEVVKNANCCACWQSECGKD